MYTIFINEKPLILTKEPFNQDKDTKIIQFEKEESFFKNIITLLNNQETNICVFHNNIEELWDCFKNEFKIIEAAGGIVKNKKNEVLFIKRFGLWDLPKGKIEKGEDKETTAVREVEEECNVFNLSLKKQLKTTYHIYHNKKNNPILKVVYWYNMICNESHPELTPQIEEGIEEVKWMNSSETKEALKNTYKNIKLLF